MTGLLSLDEARSRLLALREPLEPETLPIGKAAGRWASRDVFALRTQPPCALSAMDGYAIRFADLPGPWRRIGESAAGVGFAAALTAGETVRIFTGAPLPEGTDTVLIQEDAEAQADSVRLTGDGPLAKSAFIRPEGSDFHERDILIHAGDQLTPARIALAAAGGHGRIAARRRVNVALLSTGDELVSAGMPTRGDRIPDSNRPMLRAMLARLPVTVADIGILRDDESTLRRALDDARDADIIVTIGGASVGDHDRVRPALAAAGAHLDFWRVALKPGKPLLAGKLGEAIVLGLPGNPVSAFVTVALFLKPLIAHLSGARESRPRLISAPLIGPLPAGGERTEFLRGRWCEGSVEALDRQDSAGLVALAEAELLIHRSPHAPTAEQGHSVEILTLT